MQSVCLLWPSVVCSNHARLLQAVFSFKLHDVHALSDWSSAVSGCGCSGHEPGDEYGLKNVQEPPCLLASELLGSSAVAAGGHLVLLHPLST